MRSAVKIYKMIFTVSGWSILFLILFLPRAFSQERGFVSENTKPMPVGEMLPLPEFLPPFPAGPLPSLPFSGKSPFSTPSIPDFPLPSPASVPEKIARDIQSNMESDRFHKIDKILGSDCPSDCDGTMILHMITSGSQERYSQLYDRIKNKDKRCQRRLLQSLSNVMSIARIHEDCLEEQYKTHPNCNSLNAPDRFFEIAELVHGREVVQTLEAQTPCLECAIKSGEKGEFHKLSDWLKSLDKVSQCSELGPGQEKRVYSGTGLRRSYNIQEVDGSYLIPLTMTFSADEDYDGEVPKDQVPQEYMIIVQRCIDEANEKMLGPQGEKLKIVIQQPVEQREEDCPDSEIIEIKIGSKNHRSNAGKYEADIDCSAVTHEVLHRLGLCDEYREELNGHYENIETGERVSSRSMTKEEITQLRENEKYIFKPGYECRPVTKNSIMSSNNFRWDNVFETGINDSLLTPAQFNAILYGSCEKKNKFFNECSQLGYQNAVDNPDCIEKKRQCEEKNFSGADKQREIQALQKAIKESRGKKKSWSKVSTAEAYENSVTKDQLGLSYEEVLETLDTQLQELRERLETVKSWP